MNLDALGNIGEFMGAIGVIVSLIYVSIQLRQNSKAVRASAYQEISRTSIDLLSCLISDPGMAEIWGRGLDGGTLALDEVETTRWHSMLLATFRHWDNLYYQFRNDLLETHLWQSYRVVIESYLVYPGVVEWWHRNKAGFSPALHAFVDERLSNVPGSAAQEAAIGREQTP